MKEVSVLKKEERAEERKQCGLSEKDINQAAESWNVASRKPKFWSKFKKEGKVR